MSSIPITPLPSSAELEQRFQQLAAIWERETAHQSSSRIRDEHPAYQQIIALGEPAVPLLLRDLEVNRRRWFAALHAITGANPVAAEDAGKLDRMIDAWLAWGRERGYRW
jgi:hypothetical protein